MHRSIVSLFVSVALLFGWGCTDPDPTMMPPPMTDSGVVTPDATPDAEPDAVVLPPGTTALEQCLVDGGGLVEWMSFDNQIIVAHGEIVAMTVNEAGQISVASTDGTLKMWTITGTRGGYDLAFGDGSPIFRAVEYGPDGSWIAAGADDGRVTVENALGGAPRAELSMGSTPLVAVGVSKDGELIAAADGSLGGNIRVWPHAAGAATDALTTALTTVGAVAFLPDGTLLTAGQIDAAPALELRAASDRDAVATSWQGAITGLTRDLAINDSGDRVIAVGDGFVAVFDPADLSEPLALTEAPGHEAVDVTFDVDQGHFVTSGSEGTVRIWDVATATEQHSIDVPTVIGVGIEREEGRFITAGRDGWIRVFACEV